MSDFPQPPAADETGAEDTGSNRPKRIWLIAGAGGSAAVVALAAAVFLPGLLGSGGEETTSALPANRPAPTTSASPAPDEDPATAETFDDETGKDPFKPLLVADTGSGESGEISSAASQSSTTDGAAGSGGTVSAGGTSGTSTPTGGTTTSRSGGTTTAPTTGSSDDSAGVPTYSVVPIQLLGNYKDDDDKAFARVKVGDSIYTVSVNGTFSSGRFKLVQLTPKCDDFLDGDEPFSLCEGQLVVRGAR